MSVATKSSLLLIAVLALPALGKAAHADKLPASMPCELELEKRGSELIFELALVLGRNNALSNNEFPQIQGALDTLEDNTASPSARHCFLSYPDQKRRYGLWLHHQAGDLMSKAVRRLDATCARKTHMFITSHSLRIDAAMQNKKLAKAARFAEQMRKGLTEDPMIARCSATAAEVKKLQEEFIPSIVNQAALPKVQEKMATAYWNARQTLDAAQQAMASRDGNLAPAPESLASESGRDELGRDIARCTDYAQALTELGAPLELELLSAEGQAVEREAADSYCQQEAARLTNTLAAVIKHDQFYQDTMLERWRRVSIKGWGMEKAFAERGRPQGESVLGGGAIVWNYRAAEACSQLRFSPRGKLISEAPVACTILVGATQAAP